MENKDNADRSPIVVVDGSAVQPVAPGAPAEYMRSPFAIATAVKHETDVRIAAIEDEEEARRRYLATREGLSSGRITVGPGGGESWHTHLSYYDVVLYVLAGTCEVKWRPRAGEGEPQSAIAEAGSFVYIAPAAEHQWLNAGDDELELVWFMHFHNYPE